MGSTKGNYLKRELARLDQIDAGKMLAVYVSSNPEAIGQHPDHAIVDLVGTLKTGNLSIWLAACPNARSIDTLSLENDPSNRATLDYNETGCERQ
jgi:hypothetical protein